MKALLATVQATIAAHGQIPFSAPLVLMVSGGSDSTALCEILCDLYAQEIVPTDVGAVPTPQLSILHINHSLRGEDSDGDALFVEELARQHRLACEVRTVDIPALLRAHGGNMEQVARRERYRIADEYLDDLCDQAGIERLKGRIAVAHTLDDRVETFFMRTIVGTGPGGLASIPYVNGRVVRPLLDVRRDTLRNYLRIKKGASSWREDMTNYDTDRLRAYVRHELVPRAQVWNEALPEGMARTMNLIADESAFVAQMAKDIEHAVVSVDEDGTVLVEGSLFDHPKPLIRRVLYAVCHRVLPQDERITFQHIETMTTEGERVGFVTVLPGGVIVHNEYGKLAFDHPKRHTDAEKPDSFAGPVTDYAKSVKIKNVHSASETVHLMDGRKLETRVIDLDSYDLNDGVLGFVRKNSSETCVYVDIQALESSALATSSDEFDLWVTGVHTGDVFCPLGMNGEHKLLSDLLIDRKVPLRLRDRVSVVRCGEAIVWVVGQQLDERFRVTEHTTGIVCLRLVDGEA